jgi:prepilin-type N-terminal cleavage/methylation domain-containing protein
MYRQWDRDPLAGAQNHELNARFFRCLPVSYRHRICAGGCEVVTHRPRKQSGQQSGFTLVELLVVIAIIGILVALLLPAIQAAREAARRAQCQSNLKNVALAVINYEQSNESFPFGMMFDATKDGQLRSPTAFRPNWVIETLPYMEEQPLYDLFDFTKPINDTSSTGTANRNRTARGTVLNVLLCPSDEFNRVLYQGAISSHGDNWARTNYAANVGRGDIWAGRVDGAKGPHWVDDCRRGVFGVNTAVSYRRITDGTSKTILVGEIRSGVNELDSRGVWAMGHAGPSLLAGYGGGGDDNGPNACNPRADDVYFGGGGCENPAVKDFLQSICMTCDASGNYFAQQTVRSAHVGGVFVALCDGSVQFVDETIETTGSFIGSTCCSPWDHMIASSDSDGEGAYNGVRRNGCD